MGIPNNYHELTTVSTETTYTYDTLSQLLKINYYNDGYDNYMVISSHILMYNIYGNNNNIYRLQLKAL